LQTGSTVDWLTLAIQNTPEYGVADWHFGHTGYRDDPCVWHYAAHLAGGHQIESLAGKTDDFGFDSPSIDRNDIAAAAHR
jgi:hypothetical protein